MDSFVFFLSSVAQLEAEISTSFHERGGYIGPLIFDGILGNSSLALSVILSLIYLLDPDL